MIQPGAPSCHARSSGLSSPPASAVFTCAKVKATGVQVFNEIVQDSDGILTLPALAVGTEIEITVTGRNAVGESSPTAAVTALLP